jgi:hypothetical protein
MAAKKKKKKAGPSKKKKAAKPAKTKKSPVKKSKKAAKKAPAKKAKKTKKPVKKTVKPAKKKQIVGEGDYAASRSFDKDQASFVAKNKANIPAIGKEAEKALDGPEGDSLRDAEAAAAGRSRDTF